VQQSPSTAATSSSVKKFPHFIDLDVSLQNATGVIQNQIPSQLFPMLAVLRSKLILSSHVGLDLAIIQLPSDSLTPAECSHCFTESYIPEISHHPSVYSKSRLYTVRYEAFPNT